MIVRLGPGGCFLHVGPLTEQSAFVVENKRKWENVIDAPRLLRNFHDIHFKVLSYSNVH
jgi:hypothetical protein